MKKLKKRDTMPARLKKAKKDLEILSHNFVRRRDSKDKDFIGGFCFDCGLPAEGQQFQCGHWQPSGSCGAILRYHPHNMHGQRGACNIGYVQEKVKIDYTLKMIEKYGAERVEKLRQLRNKTIKADIIFYLKMIELYTVGDEDAIVFYLESML